MTINHKLTQHYAVTTPPRYLTTGNACKSRFIVIIPFPLTAPIGLPAIKLDNENIGGHLTPLHRDGEGYLGGCSIVLLYSGAGSRCTFLA